MDSSLIVEILLGVLSVAIAFGSYIGASRVNRAQAETATTEIDAQAYQRAREIYESAIDALEEHVNRLKVQMVALGEEVTKLQASNAELHYTNIRLNVQVKELQSANHDLEHQLITLRSRMDDYNHENSGPIPKIA